MTSPTAGGLKLMNLKEDELDLAVWRYMPFSRFISLLVYQAVWFSKLHILEDKYEGMMPRATMRMMRLLFAGWKSIPRHMKRQMHIDNEQSGRELTLVSCWFLSDDESAVMWRDYGRSTDAIAIKSTVRQLIYHIGFTRNPAGIGRVKYVNHRTHMMTSYEANQAQERAFIKDKRYAGEQELRIATFNVKTTYCVSPEGLRYTPEQAEGKHMNNFENPGLYVCANLRELISEVRVSPYAGGNWLLLLVKRIMDLNGFDVPVLASSVR